VREQLGLEPAVLRLGHHPLARLRAMVRAALSGRFPSVLVSYSVVLLYGGLYGGIREGVL
jgi:hypothetical protein